MNALLLPGNSKRHAEWAQALNEALVPYCDSVHTQQYRHWQTGEDRADVDYEIGVAQTKAKDLSPYVVIAKSIGTVIAAEGTANGALHPEKLILMGIPIKGGASTESFRAWLRETNIPITIIQNTSDPLGTFLEAKNAFDDLGVHISFAELPGDTHDYLDFNAVAKLI